MSQTLKIVIAVVITVIITSSGVYFWQKKEMSRLLYFQTVNQKEKNETTSILDEWRQIVKYYCEKSGGTFSNDTCKCPFEEQSGQTSESQYSKVDGTCQTTHGGPGGEIGEQMMSCYGYKTRLNDCLSELSTYKNEEN